MVGVAAADVVTKTVAEIARSATLGRAVKALAPRAAVFDNELAMRLAGVALVPQARALLDARLAEAWVASSLEQEPNASEVIVGGGLHAAIYAAVRVKRGYGKPLVLERGRAGGLFATSALPGFYLANPSTPGRASIPGDERGQNFIPGAPVQLSAMTAADRTSNAELGWLIRVMLGMYARVVTGVEVVNVEFDGSGRDPRVTFTNGAQLGCSRVIDARGAGEPQLGDFADGNRIKTFAQLLSSVDGGFPLRGIRSAAVIGSGPGARPAIELLLGIGPAAKGHAELDFVESVDWYAADVPLTCAEWRAQESGRYQGISSYLPVAKERSKLTVYPEAGFPSTGFECVFVNGRSYDCVVIAQGYADSFLGGAFNQRADFRRGQVLARQFGGYEVYAIGAAAQIPLAGPEVAVDTRRTPFSRDSISRLAWRTAALAQELEPPAPF
jgi:hypothetical protein